ncbi:ribonuclease P protein subunit [Candidatus Bathyarchaeota archaeon]|nr:ribonuclease P protein subunit [Candidatus Bathyarchaeota archaeon]
MPITPNNILAHEWTGLKVSIVQSTDPTKNGVSGLILNETRNTFSIRTRKQIVKIAKSDTLFATTLSTGETLTIAGKNMRYRPEDRVKRGLTKW